MKELPHEIYRNMNKMNSSDVKAYRPIDFCADCKAYIRALKAGRLMFISQYISMNSIDMFISSYEGTMKEGNYRRYDSMLITLGFDEIPSARKRLPPSIIHVSKDLNADILTKLYELGFITEKKYKKLRDIQIYDFTY